MKNPQSILITGGSSGIGQALAEYYAAPGVTLFLSGRDAARLNATAQLCEAKGARVLAQVIDVTDREGMSAWITDADREHPLDLVIANAGISGGTAGRLIGEPLAEARHLFEVNLTGVLNTIEPVIPLMIARRRGQVALLSSLGGFRGWPGAPAYSASKGAIRFYGEALRGSLRHTGVEINVICPGFVESRITASNDFAMPFFMKADRAARIIGRGLSCNRGRIAFPLPTHFVAWFIALLPDWMAQRLLVLMPAKG